MTSSRLGLLVLLLAGCDGGGAAVRPVDPAVARQALRTALDAWKAGRPIAALATDAPAVVAQDLDWQAGLKLDGYELLSDGTALDASLRVPVRLRLKGKADRTVHYLVGTDPILTVFRTLD